MKMSEEEQIKELTRQLSIIFPALKSIVKTMDSINQVKPSLENSTILFNEVIEACDKDMVVWLNGLTLEDGVLKQFVIDKENIINIMYCLTIITTILQNPEIRECLGYYEAYLKAYADGDISDEQSIITKQDEDEAETYLKAILKYLNNNTNGNGHEIN